MTLHQHSFLKYSPSEHGTIHERLKVGNEKAPSHSGWELFHLMSKMEGAPLDRPFLPKSRSANFVRLQTGLDVLLDSKANKKRSKIILLRRDHKGRFFCLRCGYRKARLWKLSIKPNSNRPIYLHLGFYLPFCSGNGTFRAVHLTMPF